jgi:tRNA A-37 threonylcarbamoyl transferase component Bud32
VKGYIAGEPVALKLYSTRPGAMQLFLAEAAAYLRMDHLQGSCIAPLAAMGRLPHSGTCVLGLKLGQPLPRPLPAALANSAKAALAELHQAGYSHNDINSGNLLVFGDKVLMCDLQTWQANPKQHSLDEDMRQLQKVLEGS